MASGVTVDDSCVDTYNDFKMKKVPSKFLTFKMSEDLKTIVVDQLGGAPSDEYQIFYDYMVTINTLKEPRYAVVEIPYSVGASQRSKIVFITFNPDSATIKHKMLYTASKQALKNKLEGADPEIQANDLEDLKENEVIDNIKRKFKS